ncbi:ribose 1,5-bisphosphokinase [Faunimonas pinastri]|uniref:Ribose 1,5-bisphosphate phosphokinase PhnN n=1 Tax=Faunimonas pinastri TaxID=1855383 RepID=A0A1H9L9F7_9HYPH|nr:phosphonate metabolism protein/1,5-bisphosphokinase (PRPP-forming) PhnN [Faunimonas pinastri]SER07775.1 ribose 1,5-bisphosphokinase [Faunimonas pinastri]
MEQNRNSRQGASGGLVLIVGPSGAGKDSLIAYVRERVGASLPLTVARRVVTRAASASDEDHDELSPDEFARQAEAGAFALHWSAHGLSYAIPVGIRAELEGGRVVVANVSRRVIDAARGSYPRLMVVNVTAPAEILAQRLARRGRESEAEIRARLAQARSRTVEGDDVLALDNSGPLETAGEALLAALRRWAADIGTSAAIRPGARDAETGSTPRS